MKKQIEQFAGLIILLCVVLACGEKAPINVEVKDTCSHPEGTNVSVQGYFSLPKQVEVTRYTKNGQGDGIEYKLILMTRQDAKGDAVFVNVTGTVDPRPNTLKMLPPNYTWKDLTAYTDDNKTVGGGDLVQLTGTVAPDTSDKCRVNVKKIAKL